jgi:hypothetical protein
MNDGTPTPQVNKVFDAILDAFNGYCSGKIYWSDLANVLYMTKAELCELEQELVAAQWQINSDTVRFKEMQKAGDRLEMENATLRQVAAQLAQRLRSIPETGATRFPDARDRAALEEYDNLVEKSLDLSHQDT